MIRSVLTLKPRPGHADALVELFDREGIIGLALTIDGCRAVELWRDGDDEILVMATWDDGAAYQRWLDHPERDTHAPELDTHLADPLGLGRPGATYQLALAGRKAETA